jgi:hypothetical protein
MASWIRGPGKIGLRRPQSTLQRLDNQCRKHREWDYKGLERRLTFFLLGLSLFPYKLNSESLKGVPTRLSDRSFLRVWTY